MKITALLHRHGGRITSLDAIEHDTYKGNAGWRFRGGVSWSDGSASTNGCIEPYHLLKDDSTPEQETQANTELTEALQSLNDYLLVQGKWSTDGQRWIANAKTGSAPL